MTINIIAEITINRNWLPFIHNPPNYKNMEHKTTKCQNQFQCAECLCFPQFDKMHHCSVTSFREPRYCRAQWPSGRHSNGGRSGHSTMTIVVTTARVLQSTRNLVVTSTRVLLSTRALVVTAARVLQSTRTLVVTAPGCCRAIGP